MYMMTLYSQSETISSSSFKETNQFYFGIETGIRSFASENNDYDFIRAEATHYYDEYYYNGYSALTYAPFVSLKAEYRSMSDKFWTSAGINYSSFNSIMGNYGYSTGQSDYFYIMLNQSQDASYYYRVKEISETNHYIGIPVDVRFSPFVPRFFRLYFKLGVDFNFKIASKQSVDFYDPDMSKYEGAVLNLFNQPKSFYATGNLGVGIQLGQQNKPNIRFEADLPSFLLTPKAFGLMDYYAGGGARICFILPLKTK
jgi:hypothetical protein